MTTPEPNVAHIRDIPGEPLRFQVASRSHPGEWHMVDLAAFNGCGRCDCIRWDTVSWPIIRDTKALLPGKRCRHVRAARERALNLTIARHLAEHPEQRSAE